MTKHRKVGNPDGYRRLAARILVDVASEWHRPIGELADEGVDVNVLVAFPESEMCTLWCACMGWHPDHYRRMLHA